MESMKPYRSYEALYDSTRGTSTMVFDYGFIWKLSTRRDKRIALVLRFNPGNIGGYVVRFRDGRRIGFCNVGSLGRRNWNPLREGPEIPRILKPLLYPLAALGIVLRPVPGLAKFSYRFLSRSNEALRIEHLDSEQRGATLPRLSIGN
jgi:hypothetical protein